MTRGATIPKLPIQETRQQKAPPAPPILGTSTPVSHAMTSLVISVRPETSIEEIMQLFLNRGISGAPVVDERDRPVGMVTKTDLLREVNDRGDTREMESNFESGFQVVHVARATVGEIMTPLVYVLNAQASIAKAAALMAYEGVHRIPIVDEKGRLVGILSALDILRWLAKESGYRL